MPRRRRGVKRELSELASAATSSTSASNAAHGDAPADTTSSAANRLTSRTTSSSASELAYPPTDAANKKSRLLSNDDEDRLGRLVDPHRWHLRIAQGRGAAVCISGSVRKLSLRTHTDGSKICLVELECQQPSESETSDTSAAPRPVRITANFHTSLTDRVFEAVASAQRSSPPAHVYVSGFAADVDPRNSGRVDFRSGKAVLRIAPASHEPQSATTWIELLEVAAPKAEPTEAPSNRAAGEAAQRAGDGNVASRSTDSDGWFATPAPPTRTGSADRANTASASGLAASAQDTRNGSLRRSASPSSRSPPEEATARASTDTPRPRSDPAFRPIQTIGATQYTSITALRNGQQANLAGVVIGAGEPRRASGGSRDLNIKINLVDMSCSANLNRQNPGAVTTSVTVMLFSPTMDRIAHPIGIGQVLLFRRIAVQDFSGKTQAVGKKTEPWSWALYDPVSGDVRNSPGFDRLKALSTAEKDHMRSLAKWYGELQGDDVGLIHRPVRSTLQLAQVCENLFFDSVVEVLKVYTHSHSPDLYVTDYTSHALFYRGTDHYLGLDTPIEYPEPGDGWGHIFQIGLWDSQAEIAGALRTGDIIRIQNLRAKLNPNGMLVGGLGSAGDTGIKIKTLKPSDEARIALEARRAAFVKQHDGVAAEAEEVADPAADQSQESEAKPTKAESLPPAVVVDRAPSTAASATIPRPPKEESSQDGAEFEHAPPAGQRQRQIQSRDGSAGRASSQIHDNGRVGIIVTPNEQRSASRNEQPNTPRVVVRCKAPSSVPDTPLQSLLTTSTCPGMHKVNGRIVALRPARPEEWARVECTLCRRLLPLEELFCTRCGESDGSGDQILRYTLRFAIILEELDDEGEGELRETSGSDRRRMRVPILFDDQAATSFVPDIDPKKVHLGSRSTIERLTAKIEALVGRSLAEPSQQNDDGDDFRDAVEGVGLVVKLAIYSYPKTEGNRTVRRFAALKHTNVVTVDS